MSINCRQKLGTATSKIDKNQCVLWTYPCFCIYFTGSYVILSNTLYFFSKVLFYVLKFFKIVHLNL